MLPDIKAFLNSIQLPYRGDCPNCNNINTFSADRIEGMIAFNCFHVNCKIYGRIKDDGPPIEAYYNVNDINRVSINNVWDVPKHWRSPLGNNACEFWMRRFGLYRPYMENRLGLRYDPRQNRLVFLIRDITAVVKGATGRSLTRNSPKWFIFERQVGCPGFVLKQPRSDESNREKIILVEDMISAAVVSQVENAAALLGTNLSEETIKHLLPFKQLIIALDPDALGKAIELQKILSFYRPTKIMIIENDLKYYDKKGIKNAISRTCED